MRLVSLSDEGRCTGCHRADRRLRHVHSYTSKRSHFSGLFCRECSGDAERCLATLRWGSGSGAPDARAAGSTREASLC